MAVAWSMEERKRIYFAVPRKCVRALWLVSSKYDGGQVERKSIF